MTQRLDEKIAEQGYNSILADIAPAPLATVVELAAPREADLAAGCVVAMNEEGKYAPVAAALDGDTVVAVLSDSVAKDADAVAPAWKTGNFARGALTCADGYELTAKDAAYLRQAGIQSEDVIE